MPVAGIYRHFKGRYYRLICLAMHSETREALAVYQALYGERECWVRPLSMWSELILQDGAFVERFAYVCAHEEEIPQGEA